MLFQVHFELISFFYFKKKQHGISSGYYLTSLKGGFTTIAVRLARSNIRPLFLPPTCNPSASLLKGFMNSLASYVQSLSLATPSTRESLLTWSRLGRYGHIVVMGGLVFFYGGGTKFFRSLQKAKGFSLPSIKVTAAVSAEWDLYARFGEDIYTSIFG